MASYDWFLRCINKINSDKPSLIGRTIYIVYSDIGVKPAIIMDVKCGIISYKLQSKAHPPTYGEVKRSEKNNKWFFKFDDALDRFEKLISNENDETEKNPDSVWTFKT